MASKFNTKKILFLSALLLGCGDLQKSKFNTESYSDISGLWSLKRSDSSYAEVYFSDSTLLFSHAVDIAIRGYKLKNDSIYILLNGKVIDNFKLEKTSYSQMKITDKIKETNYYRVNDSIFSKSDWEHILNFDEEIFAKYRFYFFSRAQSKKRKFLENM